MDPCTHAGLTAVAPYQAKLTLAQATILSLGPGMAMSTAVVLKMTLGRHIA